MPFGSELGSSAGGAWQRDEPTIPLDLAPAIITDEHICGKYYDLVSYTFLVLVLLFFSYETCKI